ncbi:MAG: glycosyltransferase family 4 protein [Firmicutes bacterium]|nr:glycosyltransferase family 4 protein [Bacillota bacterium]
MKKLLFISNISKKITNFSKPSILAAQSMGYEVHLAADFSEFKDDPEKYGVILHHIDLKRNPMHPKNIKAKRQVLNLMKAEKFDAVHCNTPVGGWFGRSCGKKARVRKIIYTAHGFYFYKGGPKIYNITFKPMEFLMARSTDALITINHEDYEVAKRMKLRKGGKVYYVPGVGIDTSAIDGVPSDRASLLREINAKNDDFIIISVGELNRNKNNRTIIEALGKLKTPSVHFILCGVGSCKDELSALAEHYGISDRVHFLGYRSDIPTLLKSADAFVMSTLREGLPRSIMEAMSAGLPCVVSDIRGNNDLIDHNGGFLCGPCDSSSFAEAINTLSVNPEMCTRMGEYNREKVKNYDTEIVCRMMNDIYIETLA